MFTNAPSSPNMVPKQHEMDGIVKEIYTAISSYKHLQSTLLILIGDHGMNDAGNHGASSAGETSPALVFMSPKLSTLTDKVEVPLEDREDFQFYSTIEQSDLAPTLGGLLGFPTPKNNLGAFISGFLPLWPKREFTAANREPCHSTNFDDRRGPGSVAHAKRRANPWHYHSQLWQGAFRRRCAGRRLWNVDR